MTTRERLERAFDLRGTAPGTREAYGWCINRYERYFGRQADVLGRAEVETFLLHLVRERKLSPGERKRKKRHFTRAHRPAGVIPSAPFEPDALRRPGFAPVRGRAALLGVRMVEKSGRAPRAHLGRIAVSAWSAGYGAVASLLRQPQNAKRLDAVLLEDGLHSDWTDEPHRVVADAPLQKYARVAEAAMRGDMLFAVTHSAIVTEGYPSSTETVGELLRLMDMERTTDELPGPRGMRQLYTSDRGDFHVKGYDGIGVKDHIDHIRAMSETVLPYLKARWEPPAPAEP